MKKNYLYTLLSLATLSLYSSYTLAACVQNPSVMNIQRYAPARTYNIQYDDLTTKTLERIVIPWASTTMGTTRDGANSTCGVGAMLYAAYVNNWDYTTKDRIAPTNIPGIGIQVESLNALLNKTYGPNQQTNGHWNIYAVNWALSIVKTGQVTTSGSLRSGMVARLTQYNPSSNSTFYLTALHLPTTIRINVLKCSIKQASYSVNLGDWYNTQFKNIGDTSDPVDIPVTLGCMQGTNIKVNVTSSSIADAATGKMNPTGANSAKGVAIQLLDKNNNPIKLNTSISLVNSVTAGDYIFGWKARYIKTANEITPGPANATATVNITYQ